MDLTAESRALRSADRFEGMEMTDTERRHGVTKPQYIRVVEGEQPDAGAGKRRHFDDALNTLARSSVRMTGDIAGFIQLTTSIVARVLEIDRSSVWIASSNELVKNYAGIRHSDHEPRHYGAVLPSPAPTTKKEAQQYNGEKHKREAAVYPSGASWGEADRPGNLSSRLDSPIGAGENQLGLLRCESDQIRLDWTQEERAFASSVADILRVVLEAQRSRQYQCELEAGLAEAKAAVRAKSEFLANVSHELRTPLNGVLGMAQILCAAPLGDDEKQLVDIILSSGCALLSQIDDLLSMAEGKHDIQCTMLEKFHLKDAIQSSIDSVAALAITKDINVNLIFDETLCEPLLGDVLRIRKTLTNLIDNAVKFTDVGDVTVAAEPMTNGRIRFSVADTGIGIPPIKQNTIFDEFMQVDGSRTRAHCGMGIGLTLAQKYVRCMGGEILVTSTVGKGATFSFELELIKESECRPSSATTSVLPDYMDLSGKRMLIAVCHPVSRMIIKAALGGEGASLTLVEDSKGLAKEAQSAKYDLILMDIEMPLVSVEDTIRQVRGAKAASVVPPIIIIADDQDQGRKMVSEHTSVIDYMVKPISVPQLFETVQRYCID